MTALVDTSVLVASTPPDLDRLEGGWLVSAMSVGELEVGVLTASSTSERARRLRQLSAILDASPVLPADRAVAARYGQLRAETGRLPSNDLWIAATALAHDLLLVTADERLAKLPLVRTALVS